MFSSYKSADQSKNESEMKFNALSELISANTLYVENFEKQLFINQESLKKIENILDKKQSSGNNLEITKKIEDIIYDIQNLENQIDNLNLDNPNNSNLIFNRDQIGSLTNFILEKYQIGHDISGEIDLLEKIAPLSQYFIFEKLRLLILNKFIGFENLNNLFDILTEDYVEKFFLKKNKNLVIKYLSKFISIRPANLDIYENSNLNFLIQAKKNLDSKKIEKALDLILIIDNDRVYFTSWIEQVENYIKFNALIDEVIKID